MKTPNPSSVSSSTPLKALVARSLDDDKAEDIEILDLRGHSSHLTDYMIIASGRSNRQVSAIAEKLVERLHAAGIKDIRTEGLKNGDWAIVDAGDIVVHVFRPEVRTFYNIEKMWRSAKSFESVSVHA